MSMVKYMEFIYTTNTTVPSSIRYHNNEVRYVKEVIEEYYINLVTKTH